MTKADLCYLSFIAIGFLADHFVLWPTFVAQSQVDPGRARLRLWSGWMILLWALAGFGIALWLFEARGWEALRLTTPRGWRLWSATALVLVLAFTFARTVVRIARSKKRIKVANAELEKLAPRTRAELGWWVALSLSAGFCEEFIFRGYLIWAFQPVFSLWGAALFSVVLFAVAHAYQGVKGILATGVIGGLFTGVVLVFESLWPAIVLHALVDIAQGLTAWFALRRAHGLGEARA